MGEDQGAVWNQIQIYAGGGADTAGGHCAVLWYDLPRQQGGEWKAGAAGSVQKTGDSGEAEAVPGRNVLFQNAEKKSVPSEMAGTEGRKQPLAQKGNGCHPGRIPLLSAGTDETEGNGGYGVL